MQLPFIIQSGKSNNLIGFKDYDERYGNISTFAMGEWFGGQV
jgi:hypothetical protein